MSTQTIDQKVVEMRFDNRQFEANVKTSMGTLDKLKQKLNLDGATKGLKEVAKAADNVGLDALGRSAEFVGQKFSALEQMAVGALRRMGEKAVDTGERLLKSLTTDNIASGWSKLEDKTRSVGTLVSQGFDMSEVEEQLERLNWFTDETSYNFTEMVSNIGKFTASGKGLTESVTAMEGIANWAALSGQNAQTASRAMYQLSQAIGRNMRLEDYNSIQNLSMDTMEFRQTALDAAVALGTLKKNIDGTYESMIDNKGAFDINGFADHLTQDAWFTSEVMMEVYQKYASAVDQIYEYSEEKGITASEAIEELGDQIDAFGLRAFRAAQEARSWADVLDSVKDAVSSGWMTTFEKIFGGYEEQRVLWTNLANILWEAFAGGGVTRNKLLEDALGNLGGRTELIEALYTALKAVFTVLERVGRAWDAVFPPTTAEQLYAAVKAFNEFVKRLVLSEETGDKLERTLRGLFSVLDIIKTVAGDLLSLVLKPVMSLLGIAGNGVLDFTANLGDLLTVIRYLIKEHDLLGVAINGMINGIGGAITVVTGLIDSFLSLPVIQDTVAMLGEEFVNTGVKLTEFFVEGGRKFKEFWERVSQLDGFSLDNIIIALTDFRDNVLSHFLDFGNVFSGFENPLSKLIEEAQKAFDILTGRVEAAGVKTSEFFSAFIRGLVGMKDKVFEVATAIREKLAGKLSFGEIFAIGLGTSIAVFAGKVAKSLVVIEELIEAITSPIEGLGRLLKSGANAINAFALGMRSEAMINIAKAILILVGALAAMTLLDQNKLIIDAMVLTALSAAFAGLSVAISKMGDLKNLAGFAASIGAVGAGVLMLAGAIKTISNIDGLAVVGALGAIAALMGGLVASVTLLSKYASEFSKCALSLIAFAAAIGLLANSIKKLDGLNLQNIGRTITLLAGAVGALLLVAKVCTGNGMYFGSSVNSAALSMLAFVVSLGILIKEIKALDKLKISNVGQTLILLLGAVAALKKVMKMLAGKDFSSNAAKVGLAVAAISLSLLAIVQAIKNISGLEQDELKRGSKAIGQLMLIFGAVIALSKFAGENAGKAGSMLLAMSGAIGILSLVMVILAQLDPQGLTQAVAAVSTLLLVFGAVVALSHFAGEAKNVQATIITMTACVAALAAITAAFSILARDNPDGLTRATVVIAGLMLAFGGMVALTKFAGEAKKIVGTIVLMGAALAEIAIILALMAGLETQPALETAGALSLVMLSLSAAMVILSKAEGISAKTAGIAALMGLVVGELALIMGILTGLDAAPSIETAASLSLLLGSMTVCMGILSKLDGISMQTVGIAAVMGAVVGELALILGLMKGLNVEPSIETAGSLSVLLLAMSAALGILTLVGLGGAAAFVGIGALATLIAGMGTIMAGISALTANNPTVEEDLDRAIMVLNKIGQGVGEAVGGIVEGVLNSISGSLPVIGQNLTDFMTNAGGFFEQVKGIDKDSMEGVKALAETLLIITGTNFVEGITKGPFSKLKDAITGENDISRFVSQISQLGPGLKDFADSVQGVAARKADMDAAAGAGEALAKLEKSLPSTGGKLSEWLFGNKSLSNFGTRLNEFGTAISTYCSTVGADGAINQSAVDASKAAADVLVTLEKSITASGGLLQKLIGNQSLADFGTRLNTFGEMIVKFCKAIGEDGAISTDKVEVAKDIGDMMSALENSLAHVGIFDRMFGGQQTLTQFGGHLVAFAKKLNEFVTAMPSVRPEQLTGILNVVSEFATLGDKVKNLEGTQKLTELINAFKTLGDEAISKFQNAFTTGVTPTSVVADALDSAKQKAETYKDTFNRIGQGIGQSLADGLASKERVNKDAATLIGRVIESAIRTTTRVFSPSPLYIGIGEFISESLGMGMESKSRNLNEAGAALGSAIETGVRDSLEVHSMSPLFTGIGEYVVESNIQGIKNVSPKAMKVAEEYGFDLRSYLDKGIVKAEENEKVSSSFGEKLVNIIAGAMDSLGMSSDRLLDTLEDVKNGVITMPGVLSGFTNAMKKAGFSVDDAIAALRKCKEEGSDIFSLLTGDSNSLTDTILGNIGSQTSAASRGYSTATKSMDSYYQKKMDWIEEEKYYNRLSLEEELAVYEELLTRYKEGSEERKKIDREIYRLHNELIAESYQKEIDWMEEEKYYNRLTTQQELDKYLEMQEKYEEGSEYRKKIDREVYRLRNELVKESYQASIDWIENEKYYDRMTTAEEIAAYQRVRDKHLEDSEIIMECDKKLYALRKQLQQEAYSAATTWIDDAKFYDRLNVREELEALKKIQAMGIGSDSDKKQLAKNIYSLEKQIKQAEKEYADNVAQVESDAAKKREDLQKQYNEKIASIQQSSQEESLNREKQYQNDVIRVQENAANERANLEQEYADKITEINERLVSDIEKLNDDYANAVQSRTDALYKAYNLFDAVKAKEEVSAATLMINLQDQVNEFGDWQDVLDQLSARGLDSELIKELQDMGPSAIAEIKALNSMTDDELEKYVALWSIKHAQAREQALKELSGMKKDTEDQIEELRKAADKELAEYKQLWEERMAEVSSNAESELASLKSEFEADMAEINANASSQLAEYEATWQESMAEVDQNANDQLDKLKKDFDEKIGDLSEDSQSKIDEMVEEINKIMQDADWEESGETMIDKTIEGIDSKKGELVNTMSDTMADTMDAATATIEAKTPEVVGAMNSAADQVEAAVRRINNAAASTPKSGTQSVAGFAQGVIKATPQVEVAADHMTQAFLKRNQKDMDIKSPSKKTEKLGRFSAMGFVNGILAFIGKTEGAADAMAEAVVDGLQYAIAQANEMIASDDGAQPVIRPVLDMTDILNGTDGLNALFGGKVISMAGSIGLAANAMSRNGDSLSDDGSDKLVSEVQKLREDVGILGDKMARIQIVLDTGVLAGAMVDEMIEPLDNALGQRQIYAGRGIR